MRCGAHKSTCTLSALWAACLLIFLSSLAIVRAQGDVEVSVTRFHNLPARLVSLDDTSSVIYFDAIEGNVYVSQDEGKSWNRATDIPEGDAMMFYEHPFYNRMAFVLTKSTKHYMTDDRGKTWRTFEVPIPPAFVSRPLSFHSKTDKYNYILYQGTNCQRQGWGAVCHDETYYTTDAFASHEKLLSETAMCQFAHSSADFKHNAPDDLIYCVAFDSSAQSGHHSLSSSRLFSSKDFFKSDNKVEELGIGKNARGIIAFAIVSKFAVVALKDMTGASDMLLYVTTDTEHWAQAHFPHASSARLRENGYTIVESTTHSLAVDVMLSESGEVGTLFVSNSNGTYFVQSLGDTNRNEMGFVDFETIYGVEGVGIANVVANAQEVEGRGAQKKLRSMITFDDGSSWAPLRAPATDSDGKRIGCDPADTDVCALHLHSVTVPHNFGRVFSSPAPGLVMGVGSVGATLKPYEDSDTFLSTDAGVTWKMVRHDAHKYEFGDKGSILVVVSDEAPTDTVRYSTDLGRSWKSAKLPYPMRARALVTVPDSTSQKFMLLGQLNRGDADTSGRYVIAHLDFAKTRGRQCTDSDFERWYARPAGDKSCLMGHKQWYRRRKPDADCYVGHKFEDPAEHEEDCPCTDADYECDFNFIRHGDQCVPTGPEPIPANVCKSPDDKYMGSSGFRLIPGNTCDHSKGVQKDKKVERSCSQAQPQEGDVVHRIFDFPGRVEQHGYFKDSTTILVRLDDGSIWQSSSEGYAWNQLFPGERFIGFYHHTFTSDRAYLLTSSKKYYYTTDTGRSWHQLEAAAPPNLFGAMILRFHPEISDNLIWVGMEGCENFGQGCHAVAYYSRDNGRKWYEIERYVRNCAWARDAGFRVDPSQIICESYRDKQGNQRLFNPANNALELWTGTRYFSEKQRIFEHVVGFAKFSEYLVVAEYLPSHGSLDLQVSLDGTRFATGQFPPSMKPDSQHAYTILESSTDSLFLHMTTAEPPGPSWGTILKSNSNGTYFGVSINNVNRNREGYVDFEKMIGLDGVALINIVANADTARVEGRKKLQSRISHNDGGSWKPLSPPKVDSNGNSYACNQVGCSLNVHGYTERLDPRATFSTPSVVGLMMAVGNVGEDLAPYTESDTFLSRDAGFTWEEVHKDAHIWEFGDSGSILVMVNDEAPTDTVLYTTDEGLNWNEYRFSSEKIRVRMIVTVPSDTSRRFILLGSRTRDGGSSAIHLDFSALTNKKCVLDVQNPGDDDFELWSPSEERSERCLFGRQTLYHRRRRDRNCFVGNQPKAEAKIVHDCACTASDFECEFNYERDDNGNCVLVPSRTPLEDDTTCDPKTDSWFERTAYRRIPHSSCDGGERLDRGQEHACPGLRNHSAFFWLFVILIPFAFCALVGYWYYRRSGLATGTIRLPGPDNGAHVHLRTDAGLLDTLASVPWFVIGMAGIAYDKAAVVVDDFMARFRHRTRYRHRTGYRHVPVDEDAQVLRYDNED